MITTLPKLKSDAIHDWTELFKDSLDWQDSFVGQVATPVAGSNVRFRLPHLSVIGNTIIASDATPIVGYRVQEGDKIVSDVILASPPAPGTTFSYQTSKVAFYSNEREDSVRLDLPLQKPRLFVLYLKDLRSGDFYRDTDGAQNRLLSRRLYMMIHVDTDKGTGGDRYRNELLGLAEQTIERRLKYLDDNGYEFVETDTQTIDVPQQEGTLSLHRGTILVSCIVHPRLY